MFLIDFVSVLFLQDNQLSNQSLLSTYLLFCSGGSTLQSTSYMGYAIAQIEITLRYTKNFLIKTFHKWCHSIPRRCKLYCYQRCFIRCRYSSSMQSQRISYQLYNLSLEKDSNRRGSK